MITIIFNPNEETQVFQTTVCEGDIEHASKNPNYPIESSMSNQIAFTALYNLLIKKEITVEMARNEHWVVLNKDSKLIATNARNVK